MELNKRLEKLIKALKMNQKGLFLLKHGTILKKLNQMKLFSHVKRSRRKLRFVMNLFHKKRL